MTMTNRGMLLKVHGSGNCHICGEPRAAKGSQWCSYPHAMLPDKEVAPGMWSWRGPGERAPEK